MAWRLTAKGLRVEPIAGIPWRELSDEEFEAAEAEMDARFPDQPGGLQRSGFFEKVALSPGPSPTLGEGSRKRTEVSDG